MNLSSRIHGAIADDNKLLRKVTMEKLVSWAIVADESHNPQVLASTIDPSDYDVFHFYSKSCRGCSSNLIGIRGV